MTPSKFDRLMIAFCAWLIAGLYVDGWAHFHTQSARESFFTPWHALFYSGFLACAIALGTSTARNHTRGSSWFDSAPRGYQGAALGVLIFMLGGIGDMLWHIFFGIETDIATQLSPTHLLLAVGMALIVTGPFQAASAAFNVAGPANAGPSMKSIWPAVLSLALLLAVIDLFTKSFHPFYIPWAASFWRVGTADAALTAQVAYLQEALGVGSVVVQSFVVSAVLLWALRRHLLPPGSVTAILGIAIALFNVALLPAAVGAGIIADVLLWRTQPGLERRRALRIFAFAVPACLYALYFVDVGLGRGGLWWPVHLLVGSIVIAGLTGLFTSYLAMPPQASALANSTSERS